MKKLNCWEYKNCGKESNGDDSIFEEAGTCPASTELCTDGVNDGKNAGRACWAIAGTLCSEDVRSDCSRKIKSCLECDFYKQVQKEEGEMFVTGSELIEMVQYKEEILQAKLEHDEMASLGQNTGILG